MISKIEILLIEDNPGDAELIREMMPDGPDPSSRFHFSHAQRLSDAICHLKNNGVQLALLDLGLPDSNGLDTVRRMRSAAPSIPIVVLTGTDDEAVGISSVKAGAQDYLVKGKVSGELLRRVLFHAVERHQHQESLRKSEQFLRSSLDALSAHIAILDPDGEILEVNRAWRQFAAANGADQAFGFIGANYLEVCDQASGGKEAASIAAGIRAVIDGAVESFEIEYPCHGPDRQRWFHVRITAFPDDSKRRVVVAHEDITHRKAAEDALKESEELFRKVFEVLPVGLWIADKQGTLQMGNPAGVKIWGGSPLVDQSRYGVFRARRLPSGEEVTPEDWALARTVNEGVTIADELLEIDAFDGVKRTILNYTAPVTDGAGRVKAAIVVNQDITALKKAEADLKASEKQLRLVIDTSPNCVFIKDRENRYLLANKTIAELYGTTPEGMLGRTDSDLAAGGLPGWNGACHTVAGTTQQKGNQSYPSDRNEAFKLPDGTLKWFRIIQAPIYLESNPGCLLGIAIDITEQCDAQVELRNSELRLKTILDAQLSQVILMDNRLKVLWPNREACKAAELPREEIMGRFCHDIWPKLPEPCPDCPVMTSLQKGSPCSSTRTTPEGRTWRIHGFPVMDDAGRMVSAVEVAEDITERIRLEDKLRQAQKMESLGTLAGGIAHDFNNILSAIIGYTQLAIDKVSGSSELESNLKEVYQAGIRATDLVRQILTFSRRTDMALKPLDISIIIREALKLLRSTLPTSIEIRQHIEKNLSKVLADPIHVHQIIMNLCTNAGHAMEPAGGVLEINLAQITVDAETLTPPHTLEAGQYLKLAVSDTGCGMTPEIMSSIFDPYFTTKDLGEGTGLGLAVVHGIVKEYGGDIVVDSTPGEGSTFTLYFPAVRAVAADSQQVERRLLPRGAEHILVVDDEPPILKINAHILEQLGYRVTTENDSLRALACFEKDPSAFDLVLSDVTMPKLTGDKLATEIMRIRPEMPVILCSGYSRIVNEQSAVSLGVRALIIKPIVKKTLATEIRRILDETKSSTTVMMESDASE